MSTTSTIHHCEPDGGFKGICNHQVVAPTNPIPGTQNGIESNHKITATATGTLSGLAPVPFSKKHAPDMAVMIMPIRTARRFTVAFVPETCLSTPTGDNLLLFTARMDWGGNSLPDLSFENSLRLE